MKADEIRKKYIKFFKDPPRNHKEIKPAPLVPENDPTTLFTSSGMQQLVPYLMGEPYPEGKRLVNSQPCFRSQDIEEIGDNRHTTFFEMLGNWSLGDYFKEEQLAWFWDFLTKELGLPREKLYVTVFEGFDRIPKDEESARIWKRLGVAEDHIFYYGIDKNWWSRSGTPDKMPAGEIGGPDSEVFFDFGTPHDVKLGRDCHPNCDCGRFLEIGNSVFIQYKKQKNGTLSALPQKNVDFGGGLERLVAAVNNNPDIFQIDLFKPAIRKIEEQTGVVYGDNREKDRSFRIVADHLRASVMLMNEGVAPGNKLQAYVLRRLIRRSVFHLQKITQEIDSTRTLLDIASTYKTSYPFLKGNWEAVTSMLNEEVAKFNKALERGLRKLQVYLAKGQKVDGKFAFDLYQTEGFPLELTIEILKEEGQSLDKVGEEVFKKEFERHKELSRAGSLALFKGGLADSSRQTIRLHTATHLLHAALRRVLGDHVEQKGSNITRERLRFDFSHPQKLTDEELSRVEELINKVVDKDLPVTSETKSFKEAVKEGALAFFKERYGEKVKVYTIGDPRAGWFSKEVCGGPHVSRTKEVGHVKIIKQEKIGSGLVRIYATFDKQVSSK